MADQQPSITSILAALGMLLCLKIKTDMHDQKLTYSSSATSESHTSPEPAIVIPASPATPTTELIRSLGWILTASSYKLRQR